MRRASQFTASKSVHVTTHCTKKGLLNSSFASRHLYLLIAVIAGFCLVKALTNVRAPHSSSFRLGRSLPNFRAWHMSSLQHPVGHTPLLLMLLRCLKISTASLWKRAKQCYDGVKILFSSSKTAWSSFAKMCFDNADFSGCLSSWRDVETCRRTTLNDENICRQRRM